jgi:hypothetical protein
VAPAAPAATEIVPAPEPEPVADVMKVKDDPDYKLYFKMKAMRIPEGSIRHKMTGDGFDPAILE